MLWPQFKLLCIILVYKISPGRRSTSNVSLNNWVTKIQSHIVPARFVSIIVSPTIRREKAHIILTKVTTLSRPWSTASCFDSARYVLILRGKNKQITVIYYKATFGRCSAFFSDVVSNLLQSTWNFFILDLFYHFL